MNKVYIKNMVCQRCITAVQNVLKNNNLDYTHIQLGEVILTHNLSEPEREALQSSLNELGFELLSDQKQQLIEKIKNIIITQVHYTDVPEKHKLSEVLTLNIHKDYSYLSNLFSEVEGITIEKYLINQRIERVKEMLIYGELNLSEIAFKNGYSSVAHLSSQFKKVTGLTPKHFKTTGISTRKSLDGLNS
ncbi:MAG: helix-turn-helix transcriptional regulator [Sphingobacteriaceae bacterium]|nr:helix-turn-helix transcriptional regulator [Sphingobacteriaceae bacterium]